MKNSIQLPSTSIKTTLMALHADGYNIMDLTPKFIARNSNVKLRDVQEQLREIANLDKLLRNA